MTGNRILIASALLFGACTSGDMGTTVTQGITCSAGLTVTSGTFTAAAMPCLSSVNTTCECGPVGTWTFTVALDTTMTDSCAAPPQLMSSYGFTVTAGPDPNDPASPALVPTYTLTDPSNMFPHNLVKVTSNGTCYGVVGLYSADGLKVWNIQPVATAQPAANASTTLTGAGDYRVQLRPVARHVNA